jgi:hypothetical protein
MAQQIIIAKICNDTHHIIPISQSWRKELEKDIGDEHSVDLLYGALKNDSIVVERKENCKD